MKADAIRREQSERRAKEEALLIQQRRREKEREDETRTSLMQAEKDAAEKEVSFFFPNITGEMQRSH